MRKRGLPPAGFLLFLSAGLLAHAPSGFPGKAPGQDQPQRAKFYALGVVCEKNVQNAKDSLGAPDGRYAEILPGGQLIVLMENKLYPFLIGNPEGGGAMADSGSVVGKGGADIGLEGWSPWQDTQGKQHYDWMILGVSVTGFILPLTSSFEGSPGVDMIRITNPGTKSLFLDAVVGYGVVVEYYKEYTETFDGKYYVNHDYPTVWWVGKTYVVWWSGGADYGFMHCDLVQEQTK